MTKAQRGVVLIGLAVGALMLVIPPWETFGGHYLGHSILTSPPGPRAPRPDVYAWALPPPEPIAQVSLSLLALQLAILLAAVDAAFVLLARPRKDGAERRA